MGCCFVRWEAKMRVQVPIEIGHVFRHLFSCLGKMRLFYKRVSDRTFALEVYVNAQKTKDAALSPFNGHKNTRLHMIAVGKLKSFASEHKPQIMTDYSAKFLPFNYGTYLTCIVNCIKKSSKKQYHLSLL